VSVESAGSAYYKSLAKDEYWFSVMNLTERLCWTWCLFERTSSGIYCLLAMVTVGGGRSLAESPCKATSLLINDPSKLMAD
jgi:hypothetical protein